MPLDGAQTIVAISFRISYAAVKLRAYIVQWLFAHNANAIYGVQQTM